MLAKRQKHEFGYVRQELQGNTPIIRVKLNIGVDCFEGVAPEDNRGCYHAVMTATRRAIGFPEDNWQYVKDEVSFRDDIDFFAPPTKETIYNGATVVLRDPEGQERIGTFKTDFPCGGCKLLWIAHACAKIFAEYYAAKGVEAEPFRPATKVLG
jgi:hypothetical protein